MVDPKRSIDSEADGEADAIDELEAAGDVEGLLAAARAYRAGDGVPRDLAACFRAYEAAARLGSSEASYAAALFYLRGGVVAQDDRQALTHLRAAADGGSVAAKVYLANLYELGSHVKADREKADVWLRSLARSAGVEAAPGTPEYARALAELGVGRYVTEVVANEADAATVDALWKKAAAYGWKDPSAAGRVSRVSLEPSAPKVAPARAPTPVPETSGPAKVMELSPARAVQLEPDDDDVLDEEEARRKRGAAPRRRQEARIRWGSSILRFVLMLMFAAASVAVGHLLTQGANLMLARGQPVPVVGPHVERILPLSMLVVTALPALIVYKWSQVAIGVVVAVLAGVGGALAWGHVPLHLASSTSQGFAAALAGFVVGLFVASLQPSKSLD